MMSGAHHRLPWRLREAAALFAYPAYRDALDRGADALRLVPAVVTHRWTDRQTSWRTLRRLGLGFGFDAFWRRIDMADACATGDAEYRDGIRVAALPDRRSHRLFLAFHTTSRPPGALLDVAREVLAMHQLDAATDLDLFAHEVGPVLSWSPLDPGFGDAPIPEPARYVGWRPRSVDDLLVLSARRTVMYGEVFLPGEADRDAVRAALAAVGGAEAADAEWLPGRERYGAEGTVPRGAFAVHEAEAKGAAGRRHPGLLVLLSNGNHPWRERAQDALGRGARWFMRAER